MRSSWARTGAIGFAAAIFTNLTQDHLDFHPTMEDYFLAKRKLFLPGEDGSAPPPRLSVLNAGDPYGRRLAEEMPGAVTFAVEADADYAATGLRCGFSGCAFTLRSPEGELELELPMPGRFNVANALGALAVAHGLGVPMATLVETLARGVRVPGRFEPVERGQDFAVLVDYAHTPDSLENVLSAAQELLGAGRAPGAGRVICVFGAGGDRDRGKRPLMGEIAARLADIAIVTSDNPRSEAPEAIIEEIMAGAGQAREGVLETVEDRRAAIARAVSLARAGDVLVIAGKGHEQGQELAGGHKIPFDDVAVAGEELDARQPLRGRRLGAAVSGWDARRVAAEAGAELVWGGGRSALEAPPGAAVDTRALGAGRAVRRAARRARGWRRACRRGARGGRLGRALAPEHAAAPRRAHASGARERCSPTRTR